MTYMPMQRVMFIAAVMPYSQSDGLQFILAVSHPCYLSTPAFNAYEELLVENIFYEKGQVFSMGTSTRQNITKDVLNFTGYQSAVPLSACMSIFYDFLN